MRLSNIVPLFRPFYRFCKEYAYRFDGENNTDFSTNGQLSFLKRHINKCSMVFDVGANKGEWISHALKLNPRITLHCFEPNKDIYFRLLKKNFPPNVIVNNLGVSSEKSKKNVYLGMRSLFSLAGVDGGRKLSIPEKAERIDQTTIDDYCKERKIRQIDLLKCDMDGYDYSVFEGAREMVESGRISWIQFKYDGCNIDAQVLLKDIFEFFADSDYSIFKLMPGRPVLIKEYDQRLENFVYKNFAIRHNSIVR
jgi:FkbM family methyltransferase